MALAFIGLGSNLGNKIQNLNIAIQQIRLETGDVLSISSFYKTKAQGFSSVNEFYNAVILVNTKLNPFDLMQKMQEIETLMGRTTKTTSVYSDRIIDLDILLYENRIIDNFNLKIPHPQMHERDFVLFPITEIAPDLIHPLLNITMAEMKNKLPKTDIQLANTECDKGYVSKRHDIPTKRFCQTLDLKNNPELIAEYIKRHGEAEIWKEIPAGIKEVGILEMEIYLSGTRLFMIVETPLDFEWDAAFEKLAALPRQTEWEEHMSVFQLSKPGASSAEKWKLMKRIFHLYD